jgi:choline dehydrogenase
MHAEIVVVGAGAAGCVAARRTAESARARVLLLEAGPDLRREAPPDLRDGWRLPSLPEWGFESEPDDNGTTTKLRRSRLLGGTSWLTRFAVRGAAADFDAWAAQGNPGWAFEDVLPAFRRLEADAEFGDDPWHGDGGPVPITRYPDLPRSEIHEAALEAFEALGHPAVADHNRPDALGVGPLPMSSRAGERVTTADAYLPTDAHLPNLQIRSNAAVSQVVVQGGRATGVRLVDGTEIGADQVILSAGTYGSPTILMRSGIGPAEHLREHAIGLHVELPGVGLNLADHPGVDFDSGWRGPGTIGPFLHSIATYHSALARRDGAPDLMFWLTDPVGDEPAFYLDPILLKPVGRGTVRLRSADPEDPPRITLPTVRDRRDLDRLIEGLERSVELAERPEIRRLAPDNPNHPRTIEERRAYAIANAYSLPHVVGTCRMGPVPEGGDVVDAQGRVYGVEGLRVIDASIIPEPPAGFPHLITIMLAERLTIG